MSSLPYQILAPLVLTYVLFTCWRLLRRFFSSTVVDKIPGPPAESFFTGSLGQLFDRKGWKFHQDIAETYGGVVKIKGMFGANSLFVYDSKALHHILVKDQYIYERPDVFVDSNRMLFGEGIFTSSGDRHRAHRKILNPVFSIAHMRTMMPIFYEVSHRMHNAFRQKAKDGPAEIDVIEWMTRLALELIGQSGLGFSFDTLAEGSEPHPYGIASKMLVPLASDSSPARHMVIPLMAKFPPRLGRWLVDRMPMESVKKMRFIVDTLHRTSVEIYEGKKHALEAGDEALKAQIGQGQDVISILMRANMYAPEDEKLSERELLGQVTSLTFAATDTTSGALSRTLHLLAMHKDAQEKLRSEIRKARQENEGADIGYDTLVSLPYLDAICRETLRLFPPLTTAHRTVLEDVVLPLGTPIRGIDGSEIDSIPLPKGTDIYISILSSNRNPEIWGPDSYEWKPERWLNPLPELLTNAHIPGVYSHLLTFLGGGRSCIGFKFSQLEMKVALALVIEDLDFSLSDKNIYWQMNSLSTPSTSPDDIYPAMPMMIRIVPNSAA